MLSVSILTCFCVCGRTLYGEDRDLKTKERQSELSSRLPSGEKTGLKHATCKLANMRDTRKDTAIVGSTLPRWCFSLWAYIRVGRCALQLHFVTSDCIHHVTGRWTQCLARWQAVLRGGDLVVMFLQPLKGEVTNFSGSLGQPIISPHNPALNSFGSSVWKNKYPVYNRQSLKTHSLGDSLPRNNNFPPLYYIWLFAMRNITPL